MTQQRARTDPGCLIAVLGLLLGGSLGMSVMADADPRQYACPPGLIWGANGAALGSVAGLMVGSVVRTLTARRR